MLLIRTWGTKTRTSGQDKNTHLYVKNMAFRNRIPFIL